MLRLMPQVCRDAKIEFEWLLLLLYWYYNHHSFKGRITHYLIIFHVYFHWGKGARKESWGLWIASVLCWAMSSITHDHRDNWVRQCLYPLSTNPEKDEVFICSVLITGSVMELVSILGLVQQRRASGSQPSFLFLTLKRTYFAFPSSLHQAF